MYLLTFLYYFEFENQATRHLFTPADRRIPRIRIETRQAATLIGQRIMVAIDGWPKNSRYPNVRINDFDLLVFAFCYILMQTNVAMKYIY